MSQSPLNNPEDVLQVDEEADYHREGKRRQEDLHHSVGWKIPFVDIRRRHGDILRVRRGRLRRGEPQGTHHRAGLPQGVQRLERDVPRRSGVRAAGQDREGEVHPQHDQGARGQGGRDHHRHRLRQGGGAHRHGDGPRGRRRHGHRSQATPTRSWRTPPRRGRSSTWPGVRS